MRHFYCLYCSLSCEKENIHRPLRPMSAQHVFIENKRKQILYD